VTASNTENSLLFAHLARALVVFPGRFGTLDELMEILTLAQSRKLERPIPVIPYGKSYWSEIVNFEALVRHGMIDRKALKLFQYADDPATACSLLQNALQQEMKADSPSFAHSRTRESPDP
jgi:predicted Rossmann-fold nucleotide-binding protein